MVHDVPLETAHDFRVVVEEGANVGWGDVCACTAKRNPSPIDELVLPTVVPVVLYRRISDF